jgi:glycosyltransferase involved in cell wall biosynthesis
MKMKIVQAAFGVFHHFELARELLRRGHLDRIYSTYPWRRLQREGIPKEFVETFPWVHTAQILLGQKHLLKPSHSAILAYQNAILFDRWTYNRVPACDALIALSGAALKTGQKVQERGGKFICDRGSTNRAFQNRLLREEYGRWNQEYTLEESREMIREEAIYQQADAIVVPSQVARRSFISEGYSPDKVHVIPYGVRLENFSQMGNPPSGGDAAFEVLFVGSISLRKGIPYLLQAFANLKHSRKHLRVVGPVPPHLKPFLDSFPQDNVDFLGALPQSEVAKYMSTSHVMVLPSIEEGLALVQGQALACGCPIIATTATGSEDLFTDGVEGFILPIRDLDGIVDRMQRLIDEPGLRERMSANALGRVQQIGGWTQYGDQWETLLCDLTQS